MKIPILAGALAAVFWGTAASAQSSTSSESVSGQNPDTSSKHAYHHGKKGEGTGGAGTESRTEKHLRGPGVSVGAGVEGFSGGLAPQINPGPTYGATVLFRPSRVLGVEVGYSGATHEIDAGREGFNLTSGADLVRNGGQAVATLGLTATPLQPYILGGYGLSHYTVRGGATSTAAGYTSDTAGNIPVGAGVRAQVGPVTADARVNYNFLIGEEFARPVNTLGESNISQGGQYQGTINIGATF